MKKTKKVISLMMAAVMTAGTLAGCGSTTQETSSDTNAVQETKIEDTETASAKKPEAEESNEITVKIK